MVYGRARGIDELEKLILSAKNKKENVNKNSVFSKSNTLSKDLIN